MSSRSLKSKIAILAKAEESAESMRIPSSLVELESLRAKIKSAYTLQRDAFKLARLSRL